MTNYMIINPDCIATVFHPHQMLACQLLILDCCYCSTVSLSPTSLFLW